MYFILFSLTKVLQVAVWNLNWHEYLKICFITSKRDASYQRCKGMDFESRKIWFIFQFMTKIFGIWFIWIESNIQISISFSICLGKLLVWNSNFICICRTTSVIEIWKMYLLCRIIMKVWYMFFLKMDIMQYFFLFL